MESSALLQNAWFIILGIIFTGFTVLDGFDLGIGALFRVLASNDDEKKNLLNIIGPVWDGNEVWLLLAGGALFAAFPNAYATVFSGFYLAFMLILFGLILRAVSIEFWFLDNKKRIWEWTFIIGSLVPSLLMGIALGNVVYGVPLDNRMEFTGSFFTLLRPYPLVLGLLGLSAVLLHGCSFALLKTGGPLRDKSLKVMKKIWYFPSFLFTLSLLLTPLYMPENFSIPAGWIFACLTIFSLAAIKVSLNKRNYMQLFLMSSLSIISLWGLAGSVQYPNLVRHATDPGMSITIFNSSSSGLSLTVMLVIALIGMPIVIGYQAFVYRVFKKN